MSLSGKCAQCRVDVNPDLARISVLRLNRVLCRVCRAEHEADIKRKVSESVGADIFECDCGQRVPIEDSRRMMRKGTRRVERVCLACVEENCTAPTHTTVTSQHKNFDPAKITFEPIPDGMQVAYCSQCGLQQYWNGATWLRLTWVALATEWDKVAQ